MKTTLSADGKIGIPDEIRQTDHLAAGDSFELERLTPGHCIGGPITQGTRKKQDCI